MAGINDLMGERPPLHQEAAIMEHYDFTIEYRPGRKNSNVDALSRLPQPDDPEPGEQARGNESEPHF